MREVNRLKIILFGIPVMIKKSFDGETIPETWERQIWTGKNKRKVNPYLGCV